MLPLSTNIREAYKRGRDDEQNFIQNLSLFLCCYLKEHGTLVEKKTEASETLLEVCMSSFNLLIQFVYTMIYFDFVMEKLATIENAKLVMISKK